MKAKFLLGLSLLVAVTSHAQPALELPINCVLGRTCFIVDLYDHGRNLDEMGYPFLMDYTGNKRTTDDYYGTRFQVYNSTLADRGADITASADGVVVSVRDQLPSDPYAITVLGSRLRESVGNSVVVDHGNGWETQYSGLLKNSVPVKRGDKVKAGDVLGKVQRFARQSYPTMHFVVRYKSIPIDPFVGVYDGMFTTDLKRNPLWKDNFEQIAFTRDVGLIATGFSKEVPDIERVKRSMLDSSYFRGDDDQILFWSYAFGLKKGDKVTIAIYNPKGAMVSRHEDILPKDQERYFAYVGRKAETYGLPQGVYRGSITVRREGETLLSDVDTIRVNAF